MRNGLLVLALLAVGRPALAQQCPDGTPPPCRAAPAPPRPSIAILDFQNLSPRDTLAAARASDLADALTERLSRVSRLTVTPRAAVRDLRMRTPAATAAAQGRALGVAYVLTGSFRRGLGRVRVIVELVRVAGGRVAWSRQLDRAEADLPAIQLEVALAVAPLILGTLRPAEQSALTQVPDTVPPLPNTVAVLPFAFPAGDTALERVAGRLAEIVTRRLQDGYRPSAVDPAALRTAWLGEGGADTTSDPTSVGLGVARATRAAQVLRGEVQRDGAGGAGERGAAKLGPQRECPRRGSSGWCARTGRTLGPSSRGPGRKATR